MVPMESGTMSISNEDTSCLTSAVSAADRLNSNIVSSGAFKLYSFSDAAVISQFNLSDQKRYRQMVFCPGSGKGLEKARRMGLRAALGKMGSGDELA
jgi:hypothetical protein